ncbi:MAG: sugar ABC transporter permease [Firmicutes bacterium]|jgi:multiple sugar transport system permease protein|nr:sugar ABC transporter permease [Bacillota bacterium]
MFRDTKAALVFILPAFVFIGLFKIWPIVLSFGESFTFTSITGAKTFVGLENYGYLFTEDPVFWGSVKTTVLYSLMINPLTVAAALGLALLFNRKARYTGFFRTLSFLPSAISMSVVAVVWGIILDPYYGLANSMLRMVGLAPQPFLTSSTQALMCLAAISLWRSAGYWMMFFLAGLQGIPHEIYEAADIDGASGLQKTFRITLPLLTRTTSFVLVANTAFNFLTFAPVYILTKGGPRGSTNLLMYESFKSAFVNLDIGRATAISSILLVIILLIAVVELRLTRASFDY